MDPDDLPGCSLSFLHSLPLATAQERGTHGALKFARFVISPLRPPSPLREPKGASSFMLSLPFLFFTLLFLSSLPLLTYSPSGRRGCLCCRGSSGSTQNTHMHEHQNYRTILAHESLPPPSLFCLLHLFVLFPFMLLYLPSLPPLPPHTPRAHLRGFRTRRGLDGIPGHSLGIIWWCRVTAILGDHVLVHLQGGRERGRARIGPRVGSG